MRSTCSSFTQTKGRPAGRLFLCRNIAQLGEQQLWSCKRRFESCCSDFTENKPELKVVKWQAMKT